MQTRPAFAEIKSWAEFSQYYWYRGELAAICRQLGTDHTGTKRELERCIEEYFKGDLIKPQVKPQAPRRAKAAPTEISPQASLLECGFAFNARFREYFSRQTGVRNFKFTADMAAAWRRVKKERDTSFTLQDMLAVYYKKSAYASYDNSACEWNQFLRDFCADAQNKTCRSKLKAASVLWRVVKNSARPKVYSYKLVENYRTLIDEYYK